MKQPDGTVRVIGRQMTAGAVFDEVAKDDIFYRRSGGGVTLSGGEPLAQARFAEAVLKLCREAGFHTAVNTSGYGPWREVRPVFESTDLVLFDLKHLDSATHRRLTRVGNALILDNLRRVRDLGVEIWVRVPVVPGLNDDPDNLDATTEFVRRELGPQVPVFLLPYHRLGESKYAALGRPVCAIESPSAEGLAAMAGRMQAAGLTVQVGGSG